MSDNLTLYGLLKDVAAKQDAASAKHGDQHIEVMAAVVALQTQMTSLIGNGQPGRITLIEKAIDKLKQAHWKAVGYCSAASLGLSLVGIAISYWRQH